MSQDEMKINYHIYDFEFFQKMKNVFEIVFLKKAHLIRNMNTNINVSIQWLNALFNECIFAISSWNAYWDFKNVLKMIQNFDLWFKKQLHEWILNDDVNSFENFVDFHFKSMLQCIMKIFERFIESNDVDDEIKNIRMRQIWTECFIKRIYVSRLSLRTSSLIIENISINVFNIISISFIVEKQKIHNALIESLYVKLNKKLNDDRVVWNMNIVRKFILYAIWFEFEHLKKIIKHESFAQWMNDFHCLWKWFKICHQKDFNHYAVFFVKTDHAQIFEKYFQKTSKIRTFCQSMTNIVLKRQKKIYIVITFSIQQIFFCKILILLNIRATFISTYNDESKFKRNYFSFTIIKHASVVQTFIEIYVKNSVDLNLQALCSNILLLDFFFTNVVDDQTIERLRRIEQFLFVRVLQFIVFNFFNDVVTWKIMQRVISVMLAQLNISIFQSRDDKIDLDQLKFWILAENDKLVYNTNVLTLSLSELFVKNLIKIIQTKRKENIIDI